MEMEDALLFGMNYMVSLPTNTYDIRANRINNLGERAWGNSGIFLENTVNSDPARIVRASDGKYYIQASNNVFRINQHGEIINQYYATLSQMVTDSEGGIVLSGRVWTGMIPKLVAQRKDSLGNNLWQEPYVEIADSLYINTQLKIQYNNGYYYYGWSGTKNGINRVAQFQVLRSDGSKLFPQGSISISNHTPLSIAEIVPSDSSKTIFIWNDATISSSTISQVYDTLGNKLWDENGVIVSYPAIAYETTTDVQGGFITSGPINQFTIVAQQVNKYGKLGEIITSVNQENTEIVPLEITLFQNYPNPFNSSTIIKYSVPLEGQVTIELYNVIGELIKTLADGFYSTGIHTVNLSSDDLPSGIYLYKMKTGIKSLTKKLIIIK